MKCRIGLVGLGLGCKLQKFGLFRERESAAKSTSWRRGCGRGCACALCCLAVCWEGQDGRVWTEGSCRLAASGRVCPAARIGRGWRACVLCVLGGVVLGVLAGEGLALLPSSPPSQPCDILQQPDSSPPLLPLQRCAPRSAAQCRSRKGRPSCSPQDAPPARLPRSGWVGQAVPGHHAGRRRFVGCHNYHQSCLLQACRPLATPCSRKDSAPAHPSSSCIPPLPPPPLPPGGH